MNLIDQWTTEQRYLPYHKWESDYVKHLLDTVNQSKWRTTFHIQPPSGLLNDPNGFSFYDGKWHLFYQAYPMGPVHGLKSWYHLTSTNLVDWKDIGLALIPDSKFDSHGVYSGSALPYNDKLFLAYTGNVRDANWNRQSFQLGALMDQNNQIEKLDQPLILPSNDYTEHFRDPQVFSYNNHYFLLLGAQDQQLKGKILTYQSDDLHNWNLLGELKFTKEDMGFMIECPNLVFTNNQVVLLFCPQGISHDKLDYQNIYPNTYVIGDNFNPTNNSLTNPSQLKNLDEGFDVYATQAFNAPDGRVLASSWIGLPEISYPSDKDGWAHLLSTVKELTIEQNQLIQRPVVEMKELRETKRTIEGTLSTQVATLAKNMEHHYELKLTIDKATTGCLTLFATDKNSGLMLHFDTQNGTMSVNRKNAGLSFAEDYGYQRDFTIDKGSLNLQIFVDVSVVEIFINDGKQVATTRVFPNETNSDILLTGQNGHFSGNIWTLRSMK